MSSARSVVLVSLLTPVGMLLGLASNWFIVRTFGLTPALDAYFVAYLFPTFIGGIIADFMGRNFIPTLDRLRRERSKEAVDGYISTVISFAIMASLVGMGLLWLSLGALVRLTAPGLDTVHTGLAVDMARVMSLAIVFFSVNTFHEYLHQARRSFFKPQFVKLALPLATLGAVVIYGNRAGEIVLAWAFLGAYVLIFLVMLPGLDYRYRMSFALHDPEVRGTLSSSGWLILSGTLSRARGFIDRYLASQLGPGAVSALALAARISGPLQQGAALGMKVVAFRNASALVAANRMEEAGRQSRQVVSIIIMVLVPISLWLAADADRLIALLFSSRHMTPSGLSMLTDATRALLLATPLMAVAPILSNLYFVLNRPRVVVIAAPMTLASYVFFVFLFYEPLGVFGIALATVAIFALSFVMITWHLSTLLKGFDLSVLWRNAVRYFLLAAASVWGAAQLVSFFKWPDIFSLLLDGSIALLAYAGLLGMLRDESLKLILGRLRRRKAA